MWTTIFLCRWKNIVSSSCFHLQMKRILVSCVKTPNCKKKKKNVLCPKGTKDPQGFLWVAEKRKKVLLEKEIVKGLLKSGFEKQKII